MALSDEDVLRTAIDELLSGARAGDGIDEEAVAVVREGLMRLGAAWRGHSFVPKNIFLWLAPLPVALKDLGRTPAYGEEELRRFDVLAAEVEGWIITALSD